MKAFILRSSVCIVLGLIGIQSLCLPLQAQVPEAPSAPTLPTPPPLPDLLTRTILFYPAFLTQQENLNLLQAFLDSVAGGTPDVAKAQVFIEKMQQEITGDFINNSPLTGEVIMGYLDKHYGNDFNALFGPSEDFVTKLPELIGSASPEVLAAAFTEFATFVSTQAPDTFAGWINSYPGYSDDLQSLLSRQAGVAPVPNIVVSVSMLGDGSARLVFTSQVGATYRIQDRDSLQPGTTWRDTPSGEVTATFSSTEYVDNTVLTKSLRFYRVALVRESPVVAPPSSEVTDPFYRTVYPADTLQYAQDRLGAFEPLLLAFPGAEDKPGALLVILEKLQLTVASLLAEAPPTSPLWAATAPARAVTSPVVGPLYYLVVDGALLTELQEKPENVPGVIAGYITFLSEKGPEALAQFIEEAPSLIAGIQSYVTDRAPSVVTLPVVEAPLDPADVIDQAPKPEDVVPQELPVDPQAEVEKAVKGLPPVDPAAEVQKVVDGLPAVDPDAEAQKVINDIPNPDEIKPPITPEDVINQAPKPAEIISNVPSEGDVTNLLNPVFDPNKPIQSVDVPYINPQTVIDSLPKPSDITDQLPNPEDIKVPVEDVIPAEVRDGIPSEGPAVPEEVDPTAIPGEVLGEEPGPVEPPDEGDVREVVEPLLPQ